MKSALLILSLVVTAPLFAQTTRCQVNGKYIECQTSPPNVVVLPPRPDPILTYFERERQRLAQVYATRAEADAARQQAAMVMARQFAGLPLDVQIASYDRLSPEIKAYVMNPNLLVAQKPSERIARDSELGKFILQLMSKGINTLDDLGKALAENPELVMSAATNTNSPNGDDRCVFVTTVLATCDTCLAGTDVEIKKLREYLESLALAEARKQGANEVEWMPFNPLRSIEGNAYRCHLPAASTARR